MSECENCGEDATIKEPMTYNKSAASRFKICQECEYLSPTLNMCKKCSCFMLLKVKLTWEKCPIGKW